MAIREGLQCGRTFDGFGLHPEASVRVVIDTDVLLSGLRSESGASRIILIAVLEGIILSLINVGMLLEYEDVLKRPENLLASGLMLATVDGILDDWVRLAEPVIW
jgi:hypothetical protein